MANEVTGTIVSSRILSKIISLSVIKPKSPKHFLLQMCNQDSLIGKASDTFSYVKDGVVSDAGAVSEGATIANSAMPMGTAVDVTVSKLGKAGEVTDEAAADQIAGHTEEDVLDAYKAGNYPVLAEYFGREFYHLWLAHQNTKEKAIAALLAGGSNVVGTTDTAMTIADLLEAEYTLKIQENDHEDIRCVLAAKAYYDMKASAATSGSYWFERGDLGSFNFSPDLVQNGFRGRVIGFPTWELSKSVETTMNGGDDAASALFLAGSGPADSPGSQIGAFGHVIKKPFGVEFARDARKQATTLVSSERSAVAEIDDDKIVTIQSRV